MADATDVEVVETAIESEDLARNEQDISGAIAGLNDPNSSFYSSIKGTDFAARKAIAKAQTSSLPIADNLGKTINLKHIIVQEVTIADRDTGELNPAPRVLLIDAEGQAYHATSSGLLSSVRNILVTLGEPETWPEPVPVVVVEQRGRGNYRFMTINFAD